MAPAQKCTGLSRFYAAAAAEGHTEAARLLMEAKADAHKRGRFDIDTY